MVSVMSDDVSSLPHKSLPPRFPPSHRRPLLTCYVPIAVVISFLFVFNFTFSHSPFRTATASSWAYIQAMGSGGLKMREGIAIERPVTVVTAYYQIPSKFDNTQYMIWIKYFLSNIPCHLYIFTDDQSLPALEELRMVFLNRTKFVLRPFDELEMSKNMTMWEEEKRLDPEEERHTKELYALWNEKVNFVMEATRDNSFGSDYFLWTDIGSFRSAENVGNLTTYPDASTTASRLGKDRVFFLQLQELTKNDRIIGSNGLPQHNFQNDIRLGGGIFGGHVGALTRYADVYYRTMAAMRENGIFIGKDQNIMASVAVMYPDLVWLVQPEPYLNDGDPWFYAQYYFSKRE
ncbi:hypothetical protein BV898_15541 [Hypsibius exemplaris]|uniref:Uncharacterized protein n=1 Tax=Hypsibius exemplaris TaxID=2072580 RepID=A0A9X6NKD4_HYPEX|nr:hypothetical protein BV898_15541 [Hypsibius exemplaris]